MRVQVYRNLRYRDRVVFSVRCNGKVITRTESIRLQNAWFKKATPRQAEQCLKSRTVCQYVTGEATSRPEPNGLLRVVCDPKIKPGFFLQDTLQEVEGAEFAVLDSRGVLCFNPIYAEVSSGKKGNAAQECQGPRL